MSQTITPETLAAARESKAWPFEEARKLIQRLERLPEKPETVLFETGYGPSGLPHIGTFGEVARTTMVRHAFRILTGDEWQTRLVCFSDDMDGLRKVPDNVPEQEMMAAYAEQKDERGLVTRNGTPLTSVPDPFGTHESFAHHNNARLQKFLDTFGFDYEFYSATECYRSGRFDETLLKILANYEAVCNVVRPTLGEERRRSYSPFLPIVEEWRGEKRRQVLHHAVVKETQTSDGTAIFQEINPVSGEEIGESFVHPVTGGHCKLQWRADWAMRWVALCVDYEMAGKDLIDSVRLSGQIARILGAVPPEGFSYELFLDENGEKISKSRGNGLTIEEWLTYASPESLSLYMFQSPRKAKRLYFDVIPRAVDEYLSHLAAYPEQDPDKRLTNPVWHIHSGNPPAAELPISFNLLLNLVSASNSEDAGVLWGFIRRYAPGASPEEHPLLDHLVGYAIRYFHDFVKPEKRYRAPTDTERAALAALDEKLAGLPEGASGEEIQNLVYEVGKAHDFENLRDWFRALYEVLLGQSQGPRFGNFVELYGIAETRTLIEKVLKGEDLSAV